MSINLLSLALPLLMQVGPDPSAGAIPGVPDELANRPARSVTPAADIDLSPWLTECLLIIDEDPARAHSRAQIRRTQTSGTDRVLANHCLGLASTRLELWSDAQTAFVAARDETPASEHAMRARFGAMAANAALGGGDAAAAIALLDRAGKDAEASASQELIAFVALDRGRALVALDRLDEAGAQLIAARDARPDDPEIRLLLATLLRRLGELDPAQTEIEAAATLAPTDPAIALEGGVIAILAGREEAARKSWNSVIALAPDSVEAGRARDYLAQLEEGPEAP